MEAKREARAELINPSALPIKPVRKPLEHAGRSQIFVVALLCLPRAKRVDLHHVESLLCIARVHIAESLLSIAALHIHSAADGVALPKARHRVGGRRCDRRFGLRLGLDVTN